MISREGNMKTILISSLMLCVAVSAQELTPRQLFYKDSTEAKPRQPAPPPAAPKPAVSAKKAAKKPPVKPKTEPETAAATAASTPTEMPPAAQTVPSAKSAQFIPTETVQPLGLRYALVKVVNGAEAETNPSDWFRSGDMVRVKVEGNRDGYLYVVSRGSSGNWKPLFPAPDINGGNNRVSAHRRYELPSETQAFTFDEQPGQEQLFVVYSAEPVRDMDELIPSLSSSASNPAQPRQSLSELAAGGKPITDAVISSLRTAYSRDLLVQTVTPQSDTPAPAEHSNPENAVYVINKAGGRVVADIRLEHR